MGRSYGGQATDPFAAMAGALRDALGLGMLVLRAAGQGMGAPDARSADPSPARATNPFAMALEAMLGLASQAASTSANMQGPMCRNPELQALMTRASMVAASSAFSYWRQLMEVSGRHQAGFVAAMGEMTMGTGISGNQAIPDERVRELVDELRAYFREVGEVAVQEARSLQIELDSLGEELVGAAVPPEPSAHHQRRWKVKP
jgi:hypothetical protein